jgi:hypothetical protein
VAAIVFNRQKTNWLIVPGFLLSALVLRVPPSLPLWQHAAMVCGGAILSRVAMRARNDSSRSGHTSDACVTSTTPIIDCGASFKFSNPDVGITPDKVHCYPLKRRRRASG